MPKKWKVQKNSFDRNYFRKLNPSVPNAPFLYPWKHQKTFSGVEKGYIGNEWVKKCFSKNKYALSAY